MSICDVIDRHAVGFPDRIAVRCMADVLTYAGLKRRTDAVARALAQRGVARESPVAVHHGVSIDFIVSLLGVMKAGGAFVPIDTKLPRNRIAHIFVDAAIGLALCAPELVPNLPGDVVPVLPLGAADEWGDGGATVAGRPLHPDELAYVIYTSGSTGTPKGVCVTHRGLDSYLGGMARMLRLRDDECLTWSFLASPGADLGYTSLFGALHSGHTLQLVPQDIALDAQRIAGYFERHPIDAMKTAPTYLSALLNALPDDAARRTLLPRRKLVLGGEALLPSFARDIRKLLASLEIINHYGPSETTVGVLAHRVSDARLTPDALHIGLGEPIGRVGVEILRDGRRVQAGTTGELVIQGESVARGYWNRPDLTADKFRPDPYGRVAGARMYHSGDLVRRTDDGEIVFCGRIDRQVKIRGYRVEVAEVERHICHLGGLRHAVVRLAGSGMQATLVAVVEADWVSGSTDESRLLAALSEKIPDYMIPSRVIALASLPLNANGKIDHAALPDAAAPALPSSDYVAPSGRVEEILAEIWAALLNLERIGGQDDFLALGGHSLMFAQVIARVRARLGKTVHYRSFFRFPTIRALAREIERLPTEQPAAPFAVQPRGESLPSSLSQESLWFLHQSMGGGAGYNLPIAVRLTGDLRYECLVEAVNWLVDRQEALRTNLVNIGGEVRLRIRPTLKLDVPIRDVERSAPRCDCATADSPIDRVLAQQLVQEEADRVFDLDRDNLIRAGLLRLSDSDHILMITLHHVISDGWSDTILMTELSEKYSALVDRTRYAPHRLEVQYADYAAWQRESFHRNAYAGAIAYWTKTLAGAPELLNLVTDRPRPLVPSHRGARVQFDMPVALGDRLADFCRGSGVTPFMVLLAGFKVLLWRHSGQIDLVVGSPVANRHHLAMEGVVGLFVNSIAIRTDIQPHASFEHHVQAIKRVMLDAYEHQAAPFEKVVEAVNPTRTPSHSPLFQVMFALQNMERKVTRFSGLDAQRLHHGAASAKFDLSLILEAGDETFHGTFEYATDLFDARTIDQLIDSYRTLLEAACDDPRTPLNALPLLRPDEAARIVAACRDAAPGPGATGRMPGATFRHTAARYRDQTAVRHAGEALTYGELHARAERVADVLRRLGVGAESRVGILVAPSCDRIVAMVGVMLAGAAYLPLTDKLPPERLAYILDDARAQVVITCGPFADRPARGAARWVDIVELREERAGAVPLPPGDEIPGSLAYTIYTSGSTGKPKGVSVSRASLMNLVDWHLRAFDVRPSDKATQLASFIFDAAVWECWPYLLVGAQLCVVDAEQLLSPQALQDWLLAQGVTISFMPTPLAETLLALPWPRGGSLRLLLVGGERLARHPAADLPLLIVNNYGPTENTVVSTSGAVGGASRNDSYTGCPSIGRPVDGCQVFILDDRLRPVPCGVEGEIYLGGDSLARGYTRADLTAVSFIPHPFARSPGERLYKSGDMARYLRDGEIEYLGRRDRQVKIRGSRIELGEIEAAIAQQADVASAAVLVVESRAADKHLVAFLTKRRAEVVDVALAAAVRGALQVVLPPYMVPSFIHVVDALPLTHNGKVDTRALVTWASTARDAGERSETCLTDTEERLLDIWRGALASRWVQVTDNFFAVGGDSIISIRLVAQCVDAGFPVSVADVFRHQTVRELAAFLDRAAPRAERRDVEPDYLRRYGQERDACLQLVRASGRYDMAEVESACPLSSLQSSMLEFADVQPQVLLYRDIFSCRFTAGFDASDLRRAVAQVVARHDILRTSTLLPGIQVVHRTAAPVVSAIDLSELPETAQRQRIEVFYRDEIAIGFDLARPALFRVIVHRLGADDLRLTLSFHHAILDGWSAASMSSEIIARYRGLRSGAPAPLRGDALTYGHSVALERGLLQDTSQRTFWTTQLQGLRAPALALAYRRLLHDAPADLNAVGTQAIRIAPIELRQLEWAANVSHVPLKSVFLAVHVYAQARLTGHEDVVTGVVTGGRPEVAGADEALGLFLNTVPFRISAQADGPFAMARSVLSHEKSLLAFQRFPVAEIEALQGHVPLFETKFNYTCFHTLGTALGARDAAVRELEIVDRSFIGMLVNFNKAHDGRDASIDIVHNTRVYAAADLERVASTYRGVLKDFVEAAQQLRVAEGAAS